MGTATANVFTGTDADTFSVDTNLETNLNNLDLTRVNDFAQNSLTWWEDSKNLTLQITDYVASQLNKINSEYDVENSLYQSIERKIIERQGVSIDQEVMEIINLQRNYEAVAQILRRIDEILQTTINMI